MDAVRPREVGWRTAPGLVARRSLFARAETFSREQSKSETNCGYGRVEHPIASTPTNNILVLFQVQVGAPVSFRGFDGSRRQRA